MVELSNADAARLARLLHRVVPHSPDEAADLEEFVARLTCRRPVA